VEEFAQQFGKRRSHVLFTGGKCAALISDWLRRFIFEEGDKTTLGWWKWMDCVRTVFKTGKDSVLFSTYLRFSDYMLFYKNNFHIALQQKNFLNLIGYQI